MLMMEVLSLFLETFFGQEYREFIKSFLMFGPDYINYVYETLFILIQVGKWNFRDAYCLPISLRNWFYKKLSDFMNPQQNK